MSQESLVKLILECVNAIASVYNSPEEKEVIERIRTRARSIPEEAFARGLAYTIVFIASKSGKNIIEKGLKSTKCEDIVKSIKNEYAGKPEFEKLSYGIYGAILLHIAKNANIIKGDKFESVIYEILRNPDIIELKMWHVLDWLKRVIEAYTHE